MQSSIAQRVNHILSAAELSKTGYLAIIESAISYKKSQNWPHLLTGQSVALIFEKPSLRTRVSFESGIHKLGGHPIYLDHARSPVGVRESIEDLAEYLSRSVSSIVARVHDHSKLQRLAEHARVPVINALSDLEHPCQALADLMTISEHVGQLAGTRLAYIGDGNNVCHSLMLASAATGMQTTVITPAGREPKPAVVQAASALAESTGSALAVTTEISAIAGHDIVYADTWTSMGQAAGADHLERFEGFRVTEELMRIAGAGLGRPSLFMHCMPAQRGVEVDAAVIDGPTSIVYDQAENRMHAQNALMIALLDGTLSTSEI